MPLFDVGTAFPDWALGVVGALLCAGIVATLAAYGMIISRLARIETKMDNGDQHDADVKLSIAKLENDVRELQRQVDRSGGDKKITLP